MCRSGSLKMSPEQLQKAGPRPKLFQVMREKEEPRDRGEISQTFKWLKFVFDLYTHIVSIFFATLLWQIYLYLENWSKVKILIKLSVSYWQLMLLYTSPHTDTNSLWCFIRLIGLHYLTGLHVSSLSNSGSSSIQQSCTTGDLNFQPGTNCPSDMFFSELDLPKFKVK